MKARNAIIAATKDIADRYLEAFGLSKTDWASVRHDVSLTGSRFDRVVVIRPHWQMDVEEVSRFERQITEHWATLVRPGAHIDII